MKKAFKAIGITLLILVLLLIVFLLSVLLYHRVMLGKEKPLFSTPRGDMIEVDGGKMCVFQAGSGDHTIVFMSGYGTPSPILDFKPLYDKLTDDFRIAVVEKFGYGYSDETDMPRDVDTMLRETREALSAAGLEAPYILCPHSASGIEAICWAQTYPEEIEGIAALDIAMPGYHEEQDDSVMQDYLAKALYDLGLARLASDELLPFAFNSDALTQAEQEEYRAIMYARRGSETMIHEAECCKQNMETISARPAPDVPMLFFTSKQMASQIFPQHPEKYLELPRKYTDHKAEYIDLDCGHYVHVEEPELIASEIRRFTEETVNRNRENHNETTEQSE